MNELSEYASIMLSLDHLRRKAAQLLRLLVQVDTGGSTDFIELHIDRRSLLSVPSHAISAMVLIAPL